MSGGALAAKHYLINSASQINPKVLKTLKGRTGARGRRGRREPPARPGPKDSRVARAPKAGKAGRPRSFTPSVWTPLTLEDKWEPFGTDGPALAEFTKDAQGFVHLKGGIDGDDEHAPMQFAMLPPGFRPTTEGAPGARARGTNAVPGRGTSSTSSSKRTARCPPERAPGQQRPAS